MLSPNFAILSAAINIIGCAGYAWDTVKGTTKPNRVGWSLWALAPTIAFSAELSQGVKLQSLITLSAGVGPILVLLASFINRKAYWKIKPFDWCCGALSLIALLLWWITGRGNIAILFSIGADLLACLPTARKAYTNPESESYNAFAAGFVGTIVGVLTISHWSFANYAFPIYLVILNGCLAGLIIVRGRLSNLRLVKNKKASMKF
jgi:hypothetical protein